MDNCLFCKIIKGEIPSQIVFEDDDLFVIKDINPKARVHFLIISRQHIESIANISEEDKSLISKMIWRAKILAEENDIARDGYKLIINCGENSGQLVKHLHLHLVGGEKLNWPV